VEQSVVTAERGVQLYRLPPGVVLCTNQDGAMRLLNRSRTTVWRLVQNGTLRGYDVAGNVVTPLADIANMMGVSETQVYNIALTYRLPLWQAYTRGG
jgi:hypothetical protein